MGLNNIKNKRNIDTSKLHYNQLSKARKFFPISYYININHISLSVLLVGQTKSFDIDEAAKHGTEPGKAAVI